jgi:hypothetical protein
MGAHHRVKRRVRRTLAAVAWSASSASVLVSAGCKRAPEVAPAPSASAPAPPVDRLAKGELPPGTQVVFGMVIPEGMELRGVFPGVAHALGKATLEDVSNYVRARVDTKRIELGAVGTVFPAVHITAGDATRLYRIAVIPREEETTELVIEDVTPPPPPPPPPPGGMTDAERWRRAGYNPNGTPIDPRKLR